MFESLEETMKHDDEAGTTQRERTVKYAVITVCSIVVFVAVYVGLMLVGG